jgi:hypothetical protein
MREGVHHVFQFLAGFEVGDFLGGHSSRVTADPGLPLARTEASEPTDLDFVARAQGMVMLSKMVSTMTSESFLVISTTRETSSIRSAFSIAFSWVSNVL